MLMVVLILWPPEQQGHLRGNARDQTSARAFVAKALSVANRQHLAVPYTPAELPAAAFLFYFSSCHWQLVLRQTPAVWRCQHSSGR